MRNEFAKLLDLMSLWPDTRPYRSKKGKKNGKKKYFSLSPLLTISLPHNGIHFQAENKSFIKESLKRDKTFLDQFISNKKL
jgi:hypothetical protein